MSRIFCFLMTHTACVTCALNNHRSNIPILQCVSNSNLFDILYVKIIYLLNADANLTFSTRYVMTDLVENKKTCVRTEQKKRGGGGGRAVGGGKKWGGGMGGGGRITCGP